MASGLPYKVTWSATVNGDGSVTVSWTVTDNNSVQRASSSNRYPAGSSIVSMVDNIKQSVRAAMDANLTTADTGLSGTLTFNVQDVAGL